MAAGNNDPFGDLERDLNKDRQSRYLQALSALSDELNRTITSSQSDDFKHQVSELKRQVDGLAQIAQDADKSQNDLNNAAKALAEDLKSFQDRWGTLGNRVGGVIKGRLASIFPIFG